MITDVLPLAIYGLPLVLILGTYWYRTHAKERISRQIQQEAMHSGLHEPASLHPVINPAKCIGCAACVKACPEANVLGLIEQKATLIGPANCIGHGACKKACPVDAIDLVFGTATRGVDIPLVNHDFETSVDGIFIAGELGGMGLIRNAIEQGRQAMDAIAARAKHSNNRSVLSEDASLLDVIIIGAGPAGLSASLQAKKQGLEYQTLEQESGLGGTVAHFPRRKLVMTQPAMLPLFGKIKIRETSKEDLLQMWSEVLLSYPINVRFSETVQHIEKAGEVLKVTSNLRVYHTRYVLLATGRRGTPRKLDIPGEDISKVVYRLIDPEQYRSSKVMVVGGGDSALEAAMAVAEQDSSTVTLVYRGAAFARAKPANRQKVMALQAQARLDIYLDSQPLEITPANVSLQTEGGVKNIENDVVIVCAGGVLPTGFLEKIGIHVEKKYGTA